MEAVITGVCVGAIMLALNGIVALIRHKKNKSKKEAETTMDNQSRIEELERTAEETRELVKLTLQICIIMGDGMVENGLNGEFKKAFCKKKEDVLKFL